MRTAVGGRRGQGTLGLHRCFRQQCSGAIHFQFKRQMQTRDQRDLELLPSHNIERRQLSEQRIQGPYRENSDMFVVQW